MILENDFDFICWFVDDFCQKWWNSFQIVFLFRLDDIIIIQLFFSPQIIYIWNEKEYCSLIGRQSFKLIQSFDWNRVTLKTKNFIIYPVYSYPSHIQFYKIKRTVTRFQNLCWLWLNNKFKRKKKLFTFWRFSNLFPMWFSFK